MKRLLLWTSEFQDFLFFLFLLLYCIFFFLYSALCRPTSVLIIASLIECEPGTSVSDSVMEFSLWRSIDHAAYLLTFIEIAFNGRMKVLPEAFVESTN